jgi:hypothetical protein
MIKCKTCIFYDEFDSEECGECHRYPPGPMAIPDGSEPSDAAYEWVWPVVAHDEYCGEHTDKGQYQLGSSEPEPERN